MDGHLWSGGEQKRATGTRDSVQGAEILQGAARPHWFIILDG